MAKLRLPRSSTRSVHVTVLPQPQWGISHPVGMKKEDLRKVLLQRREKNFRLIQDRKSGNIILSMILFVSPILLALVP